MIFLTPEEMKQTIREGMINDGYTLAALMLNESK